MIINLHLSQKFVKLGFLLLTFHMAGLASTQTFTDSNLPIFIINTEIDPETGQPMEIPDDPKIWADLKIIWHEDGTRNYVSDQNNPEFLNYNDKIKIELRGSSSQMLEKKQYGWTTYNDEGVKQKVSLLGMPSENDWILNGLAFDASLIRDYLNYNLTREMGQYATRTHYCEVIINGDYRGLYMLTEKVKDGTNRVNVEEISPEDNSGINLTGGYMTQADRTSDDDPLAWQMDSYTGWPVNYVHVLPKSEDVTTEQHNYIHNVFLGLETAAGNHNNNLATGYPSIIDVPSFVDFMIIHEFSSNVDAYQLSTYFHKDRGGKLRAGPVWDFNLSLGLDVFGDRSKTNVWQFGNNDNEGSKFWQDLFDEEVYRCYFARRWAELNAPEQPLNYDHLLNFINTTQTLISEAAVRNGQRWSFEVDPNYTFHINEIKTWIGQRITWLNANIGSSNGCSNIELPQLIISRINYNPGENQNFPESDDQEFIEISNAGTTTIDLTGIYLSKLGVSYSFPSGSTILPGQRIQLASNSEVFQARYGIPAFGEFVRNLSNKSQKLELSDGMGNVIDFVEYFDSAPWPDADGNGNYLQLISFDLDNNLASSWIATDGSLNVLDNDSELEFAIYPNPVRDIIHVNSEKFMNKISIHDLAGKQILEHFVPAKNANIDLSRLSPGVYILKVSGEFGTKTKKIIKR